MRSAIVYKDMCVCVWKSNSTLLAKVSAKASTFEMLGTQQLLFALTDAKVMATSEAAHKQF